MIKIKKSDKLVSLSLIMLLGVLFGSLALPASALTSGNVIGTDLVIDTILCDNPELDQNAVGFYLENEWLGDNQCVDDISTWNDFIEGVYPYPVHIKLIEGNTLNLNNNCPSLTPEQCQSLYGLSPMGVATIYQNTLPTSTPTPGSSSSGPTGGTINVAKIVINDNGRTKTIADFPLFVNGRRVISGATTNFPAPGPVLTVTETKDPNYTQSFSGDCDKNGQFNLNGGENKFCVVTNNDIGAPVVVPPVPPLINIVKIPSPLALPGGPGPVTYTYILSNIGTVPVIHITLVGDTCGPIVLVSGDTNSDSKLDVSERWVYRCTITLTETHTNTVTAIGWANDISDLDIANSTVVVGASVVPPLIHVIKIPSTLVLPAGGGMVTYTNIVTNPGNVALDYVSLNDQHSNPMSYISGDGNRNLKLDTNEVWTYISRRNVTETVTNTVSARGEANGLVARDISIATIVVSATEIVPDNIVPALPDTGDLLLNNEQSVEPERSNFWNIIMLAVVIIFLIIIFFFNKIKKI